MTWTLVHKKTRREELEEKLKLENSILETWQKFNNKAKIEETEKRITLIKQLLTKIENDCENQRLRSMKARKERAGKCGQCGEYHSWNEADECRTNWQEKRGLRSNK